jgi:hypothetical protein
MPRKGDRNASLQGSTNFRPHFFGEFPIRDSIIAATHLVGCRRAATVRGARRQNSAWISFGFLPKSPVRKETISNPTFSDDDLA